MLLLFLACQTPEPEVEEQWRVPDAFQWGTATAGFQVDMGCPTWPESVCNDTSSDWYVWVNDPDIIADSSLFVSGEPVSTGPGMWETFEADAALMGSDGMNGYRMSLEWSRLFPADAESAETVDALVAFADPEAVARYHEMFSALEAQGIEPLVTLNHYTLPTWVHDPIACHEDLENCTRRGWVDRDRILRLVALYAGFAAREFGDEVTLWATLNEPFATTLSGYTFPGEDRSGPPGRSLDIESTIAVMLNQIEGHAVMYDAVRAEDPTSEVGIVMNMTAIHPDPDAPDQEAAARGAANMDYLYHALYLDALTAGSWDPDLDGTVDETRADLADRLDFLGINYYNRVDVLGFPFPVVGDIPVFDFFPEFSWDPYPEGLGEVLDRAAVYGVPLYVTENGTPYVEDRGTEVLEGHLEAMFSQMEAGVDVRGYYYWSFIDNYEWNHGFDLRFGLYTFDPVTKERQERAVLDRYRDVITEGRL